MCHDEVVLIKAIKMWTFRSDFTISIRRVKKSNFEFIASLSIWRTRDSSLASSATRS